VTLAVAAACALPALLAAAAIALLRRTRWASRLADLPNERSLHAQATPRIGGLAIALAMIPFSGYFSAGAPGVILASALALAMVSLADDLRGVPVPLRFAAHLLAAAAAWISLGQAPGATALAAWGLGLLAVLAIAWATNLFNFMDGADGLAGGMALIGFGTYAIAAWLAGRPDLALGCAAIASACAGFLAWNFPPARVFLGDAGSIPLGFLAGAVGTYGVAEGLWSAAFPVMAFSPFVVDATVTLLRRVATRQTPWRAHRDHYYQRLALAGWSRRRLALAAYALMLASAASALAGLGQGFMLQCGIIFVWTAIYAGVRFAIDRTTRRT